MQRGQDACCYARGPNSAAVENEAADTPQGGLKAAPRRGIALFRFGNYTGNTVTVQYADGQKFVLFAIVLAGAPMWGKKRMKVIVVKC